MRIGTPDIYACYLGVFIAIEVKRPGERPTPAQEQVLREIAAAGGLTYVLDDASEVKRVLQDARRLRAKGG